jgi:hypothetical protein
MKTKVGIVTLKKNHELGQLLETCVKSKLMVFKGKKNNSTIGNDRQKVKTCTNTRRKTEVFNYGFDYIQLHFEVENVTSNYKMFFSTQNDVFNCLPNC